jgi:hypothetical protein
MPWPKGKPRSAEHEAKRIASLVANGTRRKQPQSDGVWACPTCRRALPSKEFYVKKQAANGLSSQCRRCHNQGSIRTRNPENHRRYNREFMRKAVRRDREKFRARWRARPRVVDDKVLARRLLNNAVRSGKIKRPDRCSSCGQSVKVTGHHHDYGKPLDVTWLCYVCHADEERALTFKRVEQP